MKTEVFLKQVCFENEFSIGHIQLRFPVRWVFLLASVCVNHNFIISTTRCLSCRLMMLPQRQIGNKNVILRQHEPKPVLAEADENEPGVLATFKIVVFGDKLCWNFSESIQTFKAKSKHIQLTWVNSKGYFDSEFLIKKSSLSCVS